ncbi:hypothetical protein H4219_000397 [Mycoemilia scoparia]|uniref:Essential protein Yae1 N-terminal domain-containing protein n=1 Tax=Mycoemilia scoparia TaxID=417184 RepID=A0A9W8AAN2_9FUNG|nr:hypothetical protein H4219_000397 [Mycoemilia scoparia]
MVNSEDEWDQVINIEEEFEKNGFRLGTNDGRKAGILEGREMGAEYGYDFGKEIGKYIGWGQAWLAFNKIYPNKLSPRMVKQLEQLVKLCQDIPESNEENSNVEDLVKSTRFKYRAIKATLDSKQQSQASKQLNNPTSALSF